MPAQALHTMLDYIADHTLAELKGIHKRIDACREHVGIPCAPEEGDEEEARRQTKEGVIVEVTSAAIAAAGDAEKEG